MLLDNQNANWRFRFSAPCLAIYLKYQTDLKIPSNIMYLDQAENFLPPLPENGQNYVLAKDNGRYAIYDSLFDSTTGKYRLYAIPQQHGNFPERLSAGNRSAPDATGWSGLTLCAQSAPYEPLDPSQRSPCGPAPACSGYFQEPNRTQVLRS